MFIFFMSITLQIPPNRHLKNNLWTIHHCSLFSLIFLVSINNNCNLEVNNANAIGKPFYAEKPVQDSIYSCSSSHNCAYSVHVLGIYKADSYQTAYHHPTRTVEVFVNVGLGNDRRPLVLVLSNREPVQWTLHIPNNVVISTVILVS